MKRFTDTEKWTKDVWFCNLSPEHKLLWLYLVDACDSVGVWEVNLRIAEILIGYAYPMDTLSIPFGEKVHVFSDGRKWWIKNFCNFQYKQKLTEGTNSKPLMSYIDALKRHGLWGLYQSLFLSGTDTLPIPYPYPIHRVQEKEEEKERDKEKDMDMDKEEEEHRTAKSWQEELSHKIASCREEFRHIQPIHLKDLFMGHTEADCRKVVQKWIMEQGTALEAPKVPLRSLGYAFNDFDKPHVNGSHPKPQRARSSIL